MKPASATTRVPDVRMWRYLQVVIALYAFVPELRRLTDMARGGYTPIDPLAILPLVAQIVFVVALFRRGALSALTPTMRLLAWLWCVICSYGLIVGMANGSGVGAIFDFTDYFLPFTVGLWVASSRMPISRALDILSRTLIVYALIASAYAIYQYIAPPPWDVQWVLGTGMTSLGAPVPYSLRVFGTLNDSGSFSVFVVGALLLNAHRLRRPTIWLLIPPVICVASLALTRVRTAWIALVVGLIVYIVLAPGRSRTIPALGTALVLSAFVFMNVTSFLGDTHTTNPVMDRIFSFTDMSNDVSANSRESFTAEQITYVSEHPWGQGFGIIGHGSKLNGNEMPVFDNGYLAHVVEVGFVGGTLYFLIIFGSMGALFIRYMSSRDPEVKSIVSVALAYACALSFAEIAANMHIGFSGLFYWMILGLSFSAAERVPNSQRRPLYSPNVIPQPGLAGFHT